MHEITKVAAVAWWLVFVAFYLCMAYEVVQLARKKRKEPTLWGIFALALSPLVILLLAACKDD